MSTTKHGPDSDLPHETWTRVESFDDRVRSVLRRVSVPLLRTSLGVVFIWFGALKVAGQTPVAGLVAKTVYWIEGDWVVLFLGVFEIVVGLGLLLGRALRVILPLFLLQMIGTFLVLVVRPDIAFEDGNPLLLTVEGEFVIKNLVLLSAGLVIASRLGAIEPPPGLREHD